MKTQEEIHVLVEAFRTVTKEVTSATDSENTGDRLCIAMLLMPLLPAIDEFMVVLKKETENESESPEESPEESSEDPLDKILHQIKPNGSIS